MSEPNPLSTLSSYETRHLVAHLVSAHLDSELHSLLALETAEKRNAWYEQKLVAADLTGYLSDLRAGMVCVARSEADVPTTLSLTLRYSALASSVRTVILKFPPLLLQALLKSGLWPVARVWTYYANIEDRAAKCEALELLVPSLPARLILEAFEECATWIGDRGSTLWIKGLVSLLPYLDRQHIRRAQNLFFETVYEYEKELALVGLAPFLDREDFEALLDDIHWNIRSSGKAGDIIASIVRYIPPTLLDYAVYIMIDDAWSSEHCWAAVCREMNLAMVKAALARIEAAEEGNKARLVRDAVPSLLLRWSEIEPNPHSIRALRGIDRQHFTLFMRHLVIVAPVWPSGRALKLLAQFTRSEQLRAAGLLALSRFIPETSLTTCIRAVRKMKDNRSRAIGLCAVAQHMPPLERDGALLEAFSSACAVDKPYGVVELDPGSRTVAYMRAEALSTVARVCAQTGQIELALRSVDVALEAQEPSLRDEYDVNDDRASYGELMAACLGDITAFLGADHLRTHVDRIRRLRADAVVGRAMSRAALWLPSEMCEHVVRTAQNIEEILAVAPYASDDVLDWVLTEKYDQFIRDVQPKLLDGLAPHLPKSLLNTCIRLTHGIRDYLGQAVALASLSSCPQNPNAENTAARALAAALLTGPYNDGSRQQALCDIAPFLDRAALYPAIEEAQKLAYDFLSRPALSALLRQLAIRGQPESAWATACGLPLDIRDEVLRSLCSVVPAKCLDQLSEVIDFENWNSVYEDMLRESLPRLSSESLESLFDVALSLAPPSNTAMLSVIAIRTPDVLREKVIKAVRMSGDCESLGGCEQIAIVIASLANSVAGTEHSELVAEAISRIQTARDQFYLPIAIAAIAAEMTQESELEQLLKIVHESANETTQSRSRAALIGHLPDDHFYGIADSFSRKAFKEDADTAVAITCGYSRRGRVSKAIRFYLSLPSWAKCDAAKGIAGCLEKEQLVEMLNDCEGIYDSPTHKSRVIEVILPFLPADLLGVARRIVFANPNKFERKPSLLAFTRRVCEVGSPLDEFNRFCDFMSGQNRLDGLYDFASIVPLLALVGGTAAVSRATKAIDDVMRWWG